jgi:hypothetical protein
VHARVSVAYSKVPLHRHHRHIQPKGGIYRSTIPKWSMGFPDPRKIPCTSPQLAPTARAKYVYMYGPKMELFAAKVRPFPPNSSMNARPSSIENDSVAFVCG